jgi:CO/xanthine dehydrogenase FAD-binding subunit
MSLDEINLHSPGTLAEAIKLLGELEGARIIAGGTDLLVDLKQGLTEAKNIISLQKIEELKGIEKKNNKIRIGALTTPAELVSDPLINQYFPALSDAARSLASYQIRSMATIGGNISSAVPSADLPPSLIAGEATVELQCLDASRKESLSSFFTGPRETTCGEGEVLTFIHVPLPPPNTGMSYQKMTLREANALAVASVAARITLQGQAMAKVIIVLGAVAPTPVIAIKASECLTGKKPSESLFHHAASIAKEESRPISDLRGSIWFRKELIEVLCQRALNYAWSRAGKKRRSQ